MKPTFPGRTSPTLESFTSTICRRLEAHDHSSASMFHVIQCAVEEALFILARDLRPEIRPDDWVAGRRCAFPGRIRLVIEDWSTIRDMYRDVAQDPLFLPALV